MNEWIDINLPWQVRLEWPETPPYPNMDDKVKAHFGADRWHWEEQFFPGIHTDGIGFLTEHPTFQEYRRIKDKLEEEYSEEVVDQKLQLHPSVAVQTVLAYRGIRKSIDEWVGQQPEMLAWINECDKSNEARKEAESKLSFCGKGLNRAGTLIELESDGKLIQMMIGSINELGGSCDDCRGINDDSIILRYKVLWNGSNSQSDS